MRPTCIAGLVALAIVLGGCAAVQGVKSSFTDKASACLHAQTAEVLDRIKQPCRYAEALAMCIELPPTLVDELKRECGKHRDTLLEKSVISPAEDEKSSAG